MEISSDQIEGARKSLADYLREQSAWRATKAEEYPEDSRNPQSAAALTDLAAWVEKLPADDQRLGQVAMTMHGGFEFMPGEACSYMAGRYGFDGPRASHDPNRWLDVFADEMVNEHLASLVDAAGDLAAVVSWAADDDPLAALPAVRVLGQWVVDREEEVVVEGARKQGMSWSRIAELLGRSRQGVWEKYRDEPWEGR